MPRTTRAAQVVIRTGLNPSYTAADNTNGEQFVHDGAPVFLHVKNANAAALTVTVRTPVVIDGRALPDLTVTVPATTGERMIGPFPAEWYKQSDGNVYVDYSIGASVTAALIKSAF